MRLWFSNFKDAEKFIIMVSGKLSPSDFLWNVQYYSQSLHTFDKSFRIFYDMVIIFITLNSHLIQFKCYEPDLNLVFQYMMVAEDARSDTFLPRKAREGGCSLAPKHARVTSDCYWKGGVLSPLSKQREHVCHSVKSLFATVKRRNKIPRSVLLLLTFFYITGVVIV